MCFLPIIVDKLRKSASTSRRTLYQRSPTTAGTTPPHRDLPSPFTAFQPTFKRVRLISLMIRLALRLSRWVLSKSLYPAPLGTRIFYLNLLEPFDADYLFSVVGRLIKSLNSTEVIFMITKEILLKISSRLFRRIWFFAELYMGMHACDHRTKQIR